MNNIRQIDEFRTLTIAGLPDDVKSREIFNLFHEFPGFESYFLPRTTSASRDKLFAFANFVDQQSAIMALQALNGMVFDLEKGSTLLIDLVKYNFPPERPIGDYKFQDSGKRQKGLLFAYGVGNIHNSASDTIVDPSTQSSANIDQVVKDAATKQRNKQIPGRKLVVNDMGKTCSYLELTEVFSSYHGFRKLSIACASGRPRAFVEYEDTECATEARRCLQDLVLSTSEPDKGIEIRFAWSKEQQKQKKIRKESKKRNRQGKARQGKARQDKTKQNKTKKSDSKIPGGNALQEVR